MPVLPTFDPQHQATGRTAGQFIEGLDARASLMDRAQGRRLREEQADQNRQKFQALMPVIRASAAADIASARAAVADATQQEELRGRAAASSVDYNERFNNILSIPDPEIRQMTLAGFQGEVAWLDTLPDYKGFVNAVNQARASSVTLALTNAKLDEALERANIAATARRDVAETGAEARRDVAETGAAARVEVAKQRPQQHTFELEKMKILMEDAREAGDEKSAAIFEGRIQKLNHIATTTGEAIAGALSGAAPAAAAPTPRSAPAAAAAAAPTAPAAPAPGEGLDNRLQNPSPPGMDQYVKDRIYRDPNGVRAKYLGDGKWERQ